MEGLERVRARFTVDLHPSKLANAAEGVRAHLSSLLLRYNEDLEGVVMSYANERVLTKTACIHPYFPYARLEVTAEVVLFRPRPGIRLVGIVNKAGADYLGLLVLGCINVAVAADAIRAEFRPRLLEHCWASSKTAAHRLEVGGKVHFDVAAVRHHGAFLSIAGSLQEPSTGAEGFAKLAKRPEGGKKQQQQQPDKQQQGQQQQQPQQQQQSGKKNKKKRQSEAAAAAQQQAPPAAQQQQQQQQAATPAPAAGAKDKKRKDKKRKDKKRKAEAAAAADDAAGAPTAAAAANSGGSAEPKKKKKRKEGKA